MKIFVSYALLDRNEVDSLLARLRSSYHDVWLDDGLLGGQNWWDVILEKIRWCDVFIAARSQNDERSRICRMKRDYAAALDRYLLPVRVGGS